jgi:catechol 2,3-dioxygenase-like lactoylglutathione lyase family enzyme
MLIRRWLLCAALALSTRETHAQVQVVGPSFAALSVPDLSASEQWYREIFGLTRVFEAAAPDSSTRVVLLAGPGLRIELVWHRSARSLSSYAGTPTPPDQVFGPAKLGFFVADFDRALDRLRAQHVAIEGTWLTRPAHVAPTDTLWTRNILVRDPAGVYVQLFERR